MATKETYAQTIINDIPEIIEDIKNITSAEDVNLEAYNERRAQINAGIIMAVFGAEILETKKGYALKFSKKPATMAELGELAGYLKELTEIEADISSAEEIPGATEAAVQELIPEKINKKSLTEYLLTGPQSVGRLEIGPTEIFILASLSEKYRKQQRNKIILISVIAAAAVAAGVTTTCIVMSKRKNAASDDACTDVDVEDEELDVDDSSTVDEPVPHVDIDM